MTDPHAEVAATWADAESLAQSPLLVIEPLRAYLSSIGFDGAGALTWHRIGEGQSNITYRLDLAGTPLVLRRGPRPPVPHSAHDMLREAWVQQSLEAAGIPVPHIVSVCDDNSVLGVPFYLMDWVAGIVLTTELPAFLHPHHERQAVAYAAIDALAHLHSLDVAAGELASLGRPEGYLRRQIDRFSSLWPTVSTRSFPEVNQLAEWLEANLPASARASVVHGDYRMGNLMLGPDAPARVEAILDWEMATLGDPLADLGYFVATYEAPGAGPTPLVLTPVTREPGFPLRDDLVDHYVQRTGADVSNLNWYESLALFKAAVFCEAIYTRWLRGERPGDEFAPTLEGGVPDLLAEALRASASTPRLHPQ